MSWEIVKLGEIAETSSGGTPNRSVQKYWVDGSIPWIKSGQLKDCIIEDAEEFITDEGLKNSSAKFFEKGTLLLALYGATAGKLGFLGLDATTNQAICSIIPKNNKLNTKYLYYYLLSKRDEIISDSAGGAQPNISQNYVKEIQIPLPPLHIQKQIAQILDTADALKRKDQQLLKKYDELAQAIFIDMFGDPVKNEKGWEVKKLGGEFKSIRYGTGSPPKYSEQGIPFLRATNIKAGRIEKKGMVFLSEKEAQKIAKCFVNEGDLIIVRSGANTGDCAYISEEYANCLAGYDLIIEMEKVKSRFYNYFLNSIWGKAIIEKLSRRAGQPHLNSEQVSNIECISPKYYLLEKFNLVIDRIEKLRKLSIETNNVNNDLFQTLLQKAFNNELVTE